MLQKHFDSITSDDELIDLVEATTKMIEGGKERVEKHIEEALLLSQFIINNTIAVQEWNTSDTALLALKFYFWVIPRSYQILVRVIPTVGSDSKYWK